jgi:hypothetical protein
LLFVDLHLCSFKDKQKFKSERIKQVIEREATNYIRVNLYFIRPKILAKIGQRKLMYLVKDLDQINPLLLTNLCLHFGTEGVYLSKRMVASFYQDPDS